MRHTLTLSTLLLLLLAALPYACKQREPSRQPETPALTLQAPLSPAHRAVRQPLDLLAKLEEGRLLLHQSPVLGYEEEERVVIKKSKRGTAYHDKQPFLLRREMALAILDTHSGDVFEKRYWLEQSEIEEANRLRRNYLVGPLNLPHFAPELPGDSFEVGVRWWNYHNSDLWVHTCQEEDGERYLVVANKFLMVSEHLVYQEDRSGLRYSQIIYVPYSRALHRPEIIERGRRFLEEKVGSAFAEMRQKQVHSRLYPGALVADTITPGFLMNIFLTEQTDPKRILEATDGGSYLTERVFARLGANGADTFRYTWSKTGALGLAQIMPSTYKQVAKAYPQAELFPDEMIGRIDIVNSIKASMLVFDDHLATVARIAGRQAQSARIFQEKSPEELDVVRAAIYNGGPGKYQPVDGSISQKVQETREFVVKFGMVRDLRYFGAH